MRAACVDRRIEAAAGPVSAWWRTGSPFRTITVPAQFTAVWVIGGLTQTDWNYLWERFTGTRLYALSRLATAQYTSDVGTSLSIQPPVWGANRSDTGGLIGLGARYNGGNPWGAEIPAAVAIFPRTLSPAEQTTAASWLSRHVGIVLPGRAST